METDSDDHLFICPVCGATANFIIISKTIVEDMIKICYQCTTCNQKITNWYKLVRIQTDELE